MQLIFYVFIFDFCISLARNHSFCHHSLYVYCFVVSVSSYFYRIFDKIKGVKRLKRCALDLSLIDLKLLVKKKFVILITNCSNKFFVLSVSVKIYALNYRWKKQKNIQTEQVSIICVTKFCVTETQSL